MPTKAALILLSTLCVTSVYNANASTTVPGSVPGDFAVSQGAVSYSIPISVAPGRGGMQPELSLNYSSQGGNGILGVGWNLGGLSGISRCPATYTQDGFKGSINFDSKDRYCLDGQRLIPVNGSNGGVGTEYRTEIDSYSRIKSVGGSAHKPTSWQVETKAGQIITYGGGAASLNLSQGVISWSASTINDTTGNNPITFSYAISQNSQYLEEISYTGGRVDVVYENRPDTRTVYMLGNTIVAAKRVEKIETYRGSGSGVLLQDYEPSYSNAGHNVYSRIESINTCNSSSDCLAPLTMIWESLQESNAVSFASAPGLSGAFGKNSTAGGWNMSSHIRTMADVNGDGMQDIVGFANNGVQVALSNSNGFESPTLWIAGFGSNAGGWSVNSHPRMMADVNGDGMQDVVGFASTGVAVALSTGSSFVSGQGLSGAFGDKSSAGGWNQSSHIRTVADVNGDGMQDIVGFANNGVQVALSNGNGFESPTLWIAGFGRLAGGWKVGDHPRMMADVNGDGMQDVVGFANGGVSVALSTGSSFASTPGLSGAFGKNSSAGGWNQSSHIRTVADVNGDGMQDIVGFANNGVQVALSNGNGFESPTLWIAGFGRLAGGWKVGDHPRMVVDINGDGMQDVVGFANGGVSAALSTGSSFASAPGLSGAFGKNSSAGGWNQSSHIRTFADVTGDGLPDIVGFANSGVAVARSVNNSNFQLSEITTSTGTKTELTYKPLTDPTVYTKGAGSTYPYQDLQYPQYVVSEVKTDNGIGGTNTVNYHYEGLKSHARGRGLLGYSKITEMYPQTDKTLETEFYQHGSIALENISNNAATYHYEQPTNDAKLNGGFYNSSFPFAGGVTRVTERYKGEKVNESITVMDADPSHANSSYHSKGIVQPKLEHSIQRSYELGNASQYVTRVVNQQHNIDAYGNVGQVIAETKGANGQTFIKVTDSQYENHTAKWHLGRLSQTTVTHESPYGAPDVRQSAFSYNTATGLLDSESVVSTQTGLPLTTTHYTYDSYGHKTQVRLSAAGESDRTTTTLYNNLGKPTQSCNALGQCESYTYTAEGWLNSTTGPNGITTTWQYDGFGRKVREDRADGTWSTIGRYFANANQCGNLFDYSGQPAAYGCTVAQSSGGEPIITQTDALGRTLRTVKTGFDGRDIYSDTHYNDESQVTQVSRSYFAGEHVYWARSEYDGLGRVTRMTEPGAHGSTNEIATQYNGLSTTVTSGQDSHQKTTLTNAIGQKVRISEETGTYTDYTYNSDGSLLTTQVADNADTIITLSYDEFGRKIAMDDPDMGQWSYVYDAFGQLKSQTDAKGQTTTMAYDVLGRMTSRTEPEGTSTWAYFGNNAPQGSIGKLQQESGYGVSVNFVYDQYGRPESSTKTINGEGSFTTQTHYDAIGRVQRIDYPGNQGFFTENIYNERGFLKAVRGLRSHAESHDYSDLQPLISNASTLASEYLQHAQTLREIGTQYQFWIEEYRGVSLNGAAHSGLRNELNQHKTLLSGTAATGQATGTTTTQAQFIPIMVGDIMVPLIHQQHTQSLPPELIAHVNNALVELEAVNQLINTQIHHYATLAEQLAVLAEQTLAAADHNYQYARTLDGAADVYAELGGEQNDPYITYWRAVDVDSSGRISAEVYGNGIVNDYAYNQATGQLQNIHSSLLVVEALRHLEYQYDAYNNVSLRDDLVNDIRETFNYDRLDRLTATHVSSNLYSASDFNNTQSLAYDALGNITQKSDVGNYTYGAGSAGIHAVTRAGSDTYTYDANGNMVSGVGRTLTWSSFNKPTVMKQGSREARFSYDASRARFKKVNHVGDTTVYVGKLFEQISKGQSSEVQQKHYIYAAGQVVAEHIHSTTAGIQTRYLHKDALGSIDMVSDAFANVVDRRSFDAWGKLRNMPWQTQAGLNDPLYLTQLPYTNKGYTGHESIQEVDLIHMNGRVYDATLARFVSADPHIQAGSLSQSYNRYSYVMNNPMKYTDPSGYFFKKLQKAWKSAWKSVAPYVGVIIGVVVAVFCTACGATIINAALTGAAIGAASAAAVGGNVLQGALTGFVTGGAAKWIGGANLNNYSKLGQATIRGVAHGIVGGTMNVIRGGKFGTGFASSFFTKIVSNPIQGYAEGLAGAAGPLSDLMGATAAALVGGTASVIGGGKFANGAQTAAIQYLFNQVGKERLERIRQANLERRGSLNPFKIIAKQFPKWWSSSETQDLRDGIQATIDIATIPFKAVRLGSDIHTGIEAAAAYESGATADSALLTIELVTGKGVTSFLQRMNVSNDTVIEASGLAGSKAVDTMLRKDCFECVKK